MLVSINAIQNTLLLGVRLIPQSYRYNDSDYCKVEGATLIVMNLINMWIVFLLSLESCLMIRFDLSDNKVASQQSLKDLILHKRNRFRTYCIFILIVVILNALSIWQFYGFGSEMDEPPVLCSFKKPSTGWDEAGWGYHWVTITTTFGILLIALYTVAFLKSAAFAKHRLKLRISGFRLFSKLICLPMIFMIINFSWLYTVFVKTCKLPLVEPIANIGAYFGHAMGGLLAAGIWATNSFVRRQLNKKTFRLICHYCKCRCCLVTIRKRAEFANEVDKVGNGFQASGSQNDLKRSLLPTNLDSASLSRSISPMQTSNPDYIAYVYDSDYQVKMATTSYLECARQSAKNYDDRSSALV